MLKKILSLLIITGLVCSLAACEKEKTNGIIGEKEGIEYYQNGEYKKALPLLQKAADSGNTESSYYLGEMYCFGKGVEKDNEIAFKYYLKSAEGEKKKRSIH